VQEKRQYTRKPVDLPAVLSIAGDDLAALGRCRDMSIGGCFVETDARPPFGTKVKIAISFPGMSKAVELDAIVRWNGPDGLGLQFEPMGALETHTIAKAISAARK